MQILRAQPDSVFLHPNLKLLVSSYTELLYDATNYMTGMRDVI